MQRDVSVLHEKPAYSERGVALVSVLWILAFLTVVASGLSLQARTETRLAHNLVSVAQAREAAAGAVQVAMFELLYESTGLRWRGDGSIEEILLGDATVQVTVFDEVGRIDLNKASADLLGKLFEAAGADAAEASALADAVIDWRDEDQLHRLNGAEDRDYEAAGRPYGAKDKAFDSVEELQLVLGMTPEIYTKVWLAVTVFSPSALVNPSLASPLVRQAVTGKVADEESASTADATLPEARPRGARVRGTTFAVYARAMLPDGASARVAATVRLQPGARQDPVAILDWRVEPRAMDRVFGDHDAPAVQDQEHG